MGLDMYLTKKTYVGAEYKHNNVKGKIELTSGEKNTPLNIRLKRVSEICERVGYWRKANQIHNWFVENVQKGVDNCGEYEVSKEQLEKLLTDCKAVKVDKDLSSVVMPTKGGFFFGATDYGEFYMEDIDLTIAIVEEALKEVDDTNVSIHYQSSW